VNDAFLVTVAPPGRVIVTLRVTLPLATRVSTVRLMVFPSAVVITSCFSQLPGASLVLVAVKVSCLPPGVVIVPFSVNTPGAVRVAVACHEVLAPSGLVADPVMDAVAVDLSQVACDCHFPVPPAALVQLPCLFTTPRERVVTEDAVPEPPRLVV
jgi:hypothetical protein